MTEFPSGTVTFLFTDIEGSTLIWEQHARAMQLALSQHNSIIRNAIEAQGGVVVKNTGDGFYAAFSTADQGLQAAYLAQKQILQHQWDPPIKELKVRMALHTGNAEPRGGDYYGQAVNRTARLCAAAHGYQILLSSATQELLTPERPDEFKLLDLGQHRLKGLLGPEHIYQLLGPGLPAYFPALTTLDAKDVNLPALSTPFLGREHQRSALAKLLRRDDVRLVTLSGPGGTGKTRLSLAVAQDLASDFHDGIRFIELASADDPNLVLPAIAELLGVKNSPRTPAGEVLNRFLRQRQMLLVLDNFEQVVAAAPKLAELLESAPGLKLLVTSREILRISCEHDYPVPPLMVPDQNEKMTAAPLPQNEAVALFCQRASVASPGFLLTEENVQDVASICRRLDGLPLALELAAARMRIMPPGALLDRLGQRLQILTGGPRDSPARQRIIHEAIDWSYCLLNENEQRLFAQLSLFVDGWSLAAAEAICFGGDVFSVLDGLASLRDKSLIQQLISANGETRFSMLETIREFAWQKFQENEDQPTIVRRYIDYYAIVADEEPRERRRLYGPDGLFQLFLEQYGNLRAAMKRGREAGAWSSVLQVGSGRGILMESLPLDTCLEWLSWMEEALVKAEKIDPEFRARALESVGQTIMLVPGRLLEARTVIQGVVSIHRTIGDSYKLMSSINTLGNLTARLGKYEEARGYYQEALQLAKDLDEARGVAIITGNIGSLLAGMGETEEANSVSKLAVRLCAPLKLYGEQAVYMLTLAGIKMRAGHYDRAREIAQTSLDQLRQYGRSHFVTWALTGLGQIATRQAKYGYATDLFKESLEILKEYPEDESIIQALEGAAELQLAQGQEQQAVLLLGAATSLRDETTIRRMPVSLLEYDDLLSGLQAKLGQQKLEEALEQGESYDWEEAIAEALDMLAITGA